MFTEPARFAQLNRDHADTMNVDQALLDGGAHGVVLFHTNRFFVMTIDQATKVAVMLVDEIQKAKEANNESN